MTTQLSERKKRRKKQKKNKLGSKRRSRYRTENKDAKIKKKKSKMDAETTAKERASERLGRESERERGRARRRDDIRGVAVRSQLDVQSQQRRLLHAIHQEPKWRRERKVEKGVERNRQNPQEEIGTTPIILS